MNTMLREFRQDASNEDPVEIARLSRNIWRGKYLIAAVAVSAAILGAIYTISFAAPVYRSSAVLMLETRQEQIVDLQSVMGGLSGDTSVINSEVEVLRSRTLLEAVVRDQSLTEDPEFNAGLRPPSMINLLAARFRATLGATSPPKAPEPLPAEQLALDQTVDGLLERISVRNLPLSLVFKVSAESESPSKAARIADAIARQYISNQLAEKRAATETATDWLSQRVAELETGLEQAETRVSAFKSDIDLIDSSSLLTQERQLKELRERLITAQDAAGEAGARAAALMASGALGQAAMIDAAQDAELAALKTPGEATPEFLARYDTLVELARTAEARSQGQASALQQSADALQSRIARQNEEMITLQQLERDAVANRLLYEHFLSRLKETAAQQGIHQPESRILSQAVIPSSPASPSLVMNVILSGFIGILVGIGIILSQDARRHLLLSSRELERLTGRPVMGQIPRLRSSKRSSMLREICDADGTALAETVRNLRTSILLSNADNPPKFIVMASALPDEGKTTMSLALAHNFARMGKKVLLIEGDVRKQIFNQYLGLIDTSGPGNIGLCSVLAGTASPEKAIVRNTPVGADILPAGACGTNPADLFSSERFQRFIQRARTSYDIVLMDTPPVLVVPDARIIAQSADALLFVVRWNSTSSAQVEEGIRMFETVNLSVTGLVLSQISATGVQRRGYGAEHGAFTDYGKNYYST